MDRHRQEHRGARTFDFTGSGCDISDTGTVVRTVKVTEAATLESKRFLRMIISTP
jgi:hypothetical protein